MSAFSFFQIFSFVLSINMGLMVFHRNPNSILNKIFLVGTTLVSFIILGVFGMSIANTFEQASFWWRFNCILPLAPALFLYFVLILTERKKLIRKPAVNAVIAMPAFIHVGLWIWNPELFEEPPQKHSWGWYSSVVEFEPISILSNLWFAVLYSVGIALVAFYYYSSTDPSERRQAKYLFVGTSMVFVDILPELSRSLFGWEIPPLRTATLILSFAPIGYAVWKYQLFGLTPVTTANNIVKTMTDGLLLINRERRVSWGNPAAFRILEYQKDELVGASVDALFWEGTEAMTAVDSEENFPLQNGKVGYLESRLRTKTDRGIPVSLAGSILMDNNSNLNGYLLIFRDISDRIKKDKELEKYRKELENMVDQKTRALTDINHTLERSQEQLRFLGKRLANAKERESARIARELHDELGQLLTSMKIELTLINKHMKNLGSEANDLVRQCQNLLSINDTAIKSVQNITKRLRPTMLDDIGLLATLRTMAREFESSTGIECSLISRIDEERYASEFSSAVYRIIQEALTNVSRHANANKVSLDIFETQNVMHISVRDNGKGIRAYEIEDFHSFGILGMVERARSFGGELVVDGAENVGTRISLKIPVRRNNDDSYTHSG